MELELKHLAGYLPYGLKMYWEDDQNRPQEAWELKCDAVDFVLKNQNKPILRPISDLTKEIELNGEKFVPSLFLRKHYISESMGINVATYSYRVVQKMLEWHFDIYGLIENNLAIDKNTL